MKKILFIIAVILVSLTTSAQKVYDLDTPKTEQELIGKSKLTKDKAIYKGDQHPIYMSERGKLFIIYTNKKGNPAKRYVMSHRLRNNYLPIVCN
jgi:hypothetical protein